MPFVLETIKILSGTLRKGAAHRLLRRAFYPCHIHNRRRKLQEFQPYKTDDVPKPGLFNALLEKITLTVIDYLSAQIKAGAQAVQIFDSWAGILAPYDYEKVVFPHVKTAIKALKKLDVPVIYFANDCPGLIEIVKKCGADVIGIDWRIDMAHA